MKTIKKLSSLVCISLTLLFANCNKNENDSLDKSIEQVSYNDMDGFFKANEVPTQSFDVDITSGATITGEKGTVITLPANIFVTQSGDPVTGNIQVEIKEVFDASDMVLSNAPTNAINSLGENTFLLSEGETEIIAKKDGAELKVNGDRSFTISVPATTVNDDTMKGFAGTATEAGGILWETAKRDRPTGNGAGILYNPAPSSYIYDTFNTSWSNCDKFYNYQGDKTTNKINLNASPNIDDTVLFMIFKEGDLPAVVKLFTTYENGLRSYDNSLPVGLEVTFVAITLKDNQQYLAVKNKTIAEDEEFSLTFETASTQMIKDALVSLN